MFSIVIPVHNEEHFLPACIEAIKKSALKAKQDYEIIVVLNRCSDRSPEIAEAAGCKTLINNIKNLSAIRNTGISAAEGDLIVTIDADSLMCESMLSKIVQVMSSKKFIGGGVNIIPDRISLGILLSMIALLPFLLYWRILVGVFFARKEDLLAVGGFNEQLFSAEDVDLGIRLRKFGKTKGLKYKNLWFEYIITSSRKFDHFGDWFAFKHPLMMLKLLRGKESKEANQIWYDFQENQRKK